MRRRRWSGRFADQTFRFIFPVLRAPSIYTPQQRSLPYPARSTLRNIECESSRNTLSLHFHISLLRFQPNREFVCERAERATITFPSWYVTNFPDQLGCRISTCFRLLVLHQSLLSKILTPHLLSHVCFFFIRIMIRLTLPLINCARSWIASTTSVTCLSLPMLITASRPLPIR